MAEEDDWARVAPGNYYPAQGPIRPPTMAPPPQPMANMAAAPKADARPPRDMQDQLARMQPPPAPVNVGVPAPGVPPPAPGFAAGPPGPPTNQASTHVPPMPPNLSNEDQQKFQQIYGTTPQAAKAQREKFGLTGILEVVRMHDPHLNTLALGMDLTALGQMNFPDAFHLNAGIELPPTRREPDYNLPQSYFSSPPALKQSHVSKFSGETLFYMFYNMPKENHQALAAQELYKKGWKYQKSEKLWYLVHQPQVGEPRWYVWDPNTWERKDARPQDFSSNQFLTEEEVQVRFPQMPQ